MKVPTQIYKIVQHHVQSSWIFCLEHGEEATKFNNSGWIKTRIRSTPGN